MQDVYKQPKCIGKKFELFFFEKYRKLSYRRIFANIIASIWAHIFITEG